jgi:hypothetical protein
LAEEAAKLPDFNKMIKYKASEISSNSKLLRDLLKRPLPLHVPADALPSVVDTANFPNAIPAQRIIYIGTELKSAAADGDLEAMKMCTWSYRKIWYALNCWEYWVEKKKTPQHFKTQEQKNQTLAMARFLESPDEYILALEEIETTEETLDRLA